MPLSLHAAIAICDQHLSPQAHATLCVFSTLFQAREFSKECPDGESSVSRNFGELLKAGLLENWDTERYILHQTIAHYVYWARP